VKTPKIKKKTLLPTMPGVPKISLKTIMTIPPQKPQGFKLDRMKSVRRMKNPRIEKMQELVYKIKEADYKVDIFEANQLTAGFALPFVGIHIFQTSTFLDTYQIDLEVLEHFLEKVHLGYGLNKNPYHNSIHGADVMYTVFTFFKRSSRLQDELSTLDSLSTILAACVHDLKHNGRNNAFHVKHATNLALIYNDSSPLENMHVSETFRILQQDESNILKSLSKVDYGTVRKNMVCSLAVCFRHLVCVSLSLSSHVYYLQQQQQQIVSILATDMASHFNHIADFQAKMKAEHHDGEPLVPHDLVLEMCLHVADISNATKTTSIYRRCAENVMEEFFQQGDVEKDEGETVIQMFDRDTVDMQKSQGGFIDYIVRPTFEAWGEYLHEMRDTFMKNLDANRHIDWSDFKPLKRGEWKEEETQEELH